MRQIRKLVLPGIFRRPARSLALGLLAALLSAAVLDGTMILQSMRGGFSSMEDRLGADIMVVPYAALSRKNFENELFLGNTGNFYLPAQTFEEISQLEGIRRICGQFYLTAVDLKVCEAPVHLIAYDPDSDFIVAPWITEKNKGAGEPMSAVAGADLRLKPGDSLEIYGVDVTVRAKLDRTGTDYDTSLFLDRDSVRTLAEASGDEKLLSYDRMDSGRAVSCILIDTEEGYDTESVKNDINIHFKKLRALQSKKLVSSMSAGMGGVAGTAGILIAAVWVIGLAVLIGAFVLMTSERSRELALFRAMGASRKQMTGIVVREAAVLCLAGSLAGAAGGLAILTVLSGALEDRMRMPFVMPGAGWIAVCALLAFVLAGAAGCAAAGFTARKIGRKDAAAILRDGE